MIRLDLAKADFCFFWLDEKSRKILINEVKVFVSAVVDVIPKPLIPSNEEKGLPHSKFSRI